MYNSKQNIRPKITHVHQLRISALKPCHMIQNRISALKQSILTTHKTKKESPPKTGKQKCKTTSAIACIGRKLPHEATHPYQTAEPPPDGKTARLMGLVSCVTCP